MHSLPAWHIHDRQPAGALWKSQLFWWEIYIILCSAECIIYRYNDIIINRPTQAVQYTFCMECAHNKLWKPLMDLYDWMTDRCSLISSISSDFYFFTPWSLDLFIRVPSQLHGEHTVLQPFRRIELITHYVISVLPGTHFHLSQVRHLRVPCPRTQHRNNIPLLRGRNKICLWKSCTKRDKKPHGRQQHWQSSAL